MKSSSCLRKFFIVLTAFIVFPLLNSCQKKIQRIVAITQIIDHPAIDQERHGVIDALKDAGYKDNNNIKIVFENAQGNLGTAAQIAHKFVSLKPDVVVAVTTPSAQALYTPTKNYNIPLVFTAVTDPIAAKLIRSATDKDPHITGVSDNVPVAPVTNLVQQLLPGINKIGVVYNLGEINSVTWVETLEKHFQSLGLTLEKVPISKTADVQQAVELLTNKKAQAIIVPRDNMVVSALSTICKTAYTHKIPVFTADTSLIDRPTVDSALAAASFDHYSVGYKAGQLVARILSGEKPSSMPVVFDHDVLYKINPHALESYKITIPEEVQDLIKQEHTPS